MNDSRHYLILDKIKQDILIYNKIKKQTNKLLLFTLSTTSKVEDTSYLTPVREFDKFILMGAVIFDINLIIPIVNNIEKYIDYLFVDAEKKIKYCKYDIYEEYRSDFDYTGNISKYLFNSKKRLKIIEYKPNDITVNSVWSFISQKFNNLSGLKITILGLGNIGSKLALKLVECGASINVHSRNHLKGSKITDSINAIKHENTTARLKYFEDKIESCLNTEIIIGCTNGIQVITGKLIENNTNLKMIIDVGKNNISDCALNFNNSIEIYRADVTGSLYGFINEALYMENLIKNNYGRMTINNIELVSGGMYGREGALILNSISKPTKIIGVSDGHGKIKIINNNTDMRNIDFIKNKFKID